MLRCHTKFNGYGIECTIFIHVLYVYDSLSNEDVLLYRFFQT